MEYYLDLVPSADLAGYFTAAGPGRGHQLARLGWRVNSIAVHATGGRGWTMAVLWQRQDQEPPA